MIILQYIKFKRNNENRSLETFPQNYVYTSTRLWSQKLGTQNPVLVTEFCNSMWTGTAGPWLRGQRAISSRSILKSSLSLILICTKIKNYQNRLWRIIIIQILEAYHWFDWHIKAYTINMINPRRLGYCDLLRVDH